MSHGVQSQSAFMNYKASKKLQQLALNPIHLNEDGILTPERVSQFFAEACGYKLLYATERVTEEVLNALEELAREAHAIEKMKKMQAGDTMNFVLNCQSENRAVLHTATRDFFDYPQTGTKAKELTSLAKQEIEKLKVFLAKLDTEKKFDTMVVIGIGGSEQGPKANYTALKYLLKPGRSVHFIANVDPDNAAEVLKQINLKKTLVVTISKSGTTLETETNEELIKEKMKGEGLNPRDHLISITMPETPMDDSETYMQTFYLWDSIGGRYSTSSMVGGVVLAFAFGFDVFWEFLKGAHAMDRAALDENLKKNLPLLAALLGIWNHNYCKYPTLAIIPYSQALSDYPAHLQQVDMESNGKWIDQTGKAVDFNTGPVLWGSLGTNAQHSYFQLLHQGTDTIPLFIIGYKTSQYSEDLEVHRTTCQEKLLANLFAQSMGLALGNRPDNPNKFCPGNRPTTLLLGSKLTPFAAGALLSFYEHKVAFQGFIWGLNSFDQEGVQLGKVIANRLISRFGSKRDKNLEEKDPLGEAFLAHLDHL